MEKLVETAEMTLEKLKQLKLDEGLEKDIAWCLGSYKFDNVPTGLIEKCKEALELLKAEMEKKPRSVPKKLIDNLEAL